MSESNIQYLTREYDDLSDFINTRAYFYIFKIPVNVKVDSDKFERLFLVKTGISTKGFIGVVRRLRRHHNNWKEYGYDLNFPTLKDIKKDIDLLIHKTDNIAAIIPLEDKYKPLDYEKEMQQVLGTVVPGGFLISTYGRNINHTEYTLLEESIFNTIRSEFINQWNEAFFDPEFIYDIMVTREFEYEDLYNVTIGRKKCEMWLKYSKPKLESIIDDFKRLKIKAPDDSIINLDILSNKKKKNKKNIIVIETENQILKIKVKSKSKKKKTKSEKSIMKVTME